MVIWFPEMLPFKKSTVENVGTPSHWLVGQGLDTKSNVCPISVQTLSNVCPIDGKVQDMSSQIQSLSRVCRDPVQFKGSWTVIGHGNQGYVQTLSKRILLDCISLLWTMTGQTLDRDKFHFLISGEFTILDSLWTNFEHGQTVD